MNPYEQYMYNGSLIESVKDTLLKYGYVYDEHHGWYNENEKFLSEDQKRIARIGIEKMKKAVEENNKLIKELKL
jgi:hypothetical protein